MEIPFDFKFRLVLIGNSGVGKTSLVTKYVDNFFSLSFVATAGVDFKIKTLNIDGKTIKLQIWDTAGQERFSSISPMYTRKADGVVLIYDITDDNSIESISKWMDNIKEHTPDNVKQVLIGNKIDRKEKRVVSTEKGEKLAKSLGIPFFETSAFTGCNVNDAFEALVKTIADKYDESITHESGGIKLEKPCGTHFSKSCCYKSWS